MHPPPCLLSLHRFQRRALRKRIMVAENTPAGSLQPAALTLTVLSRSYCSLCQKMIDALAPWQAQYGFDIEVIDVDEDEELVEHFNELVPVLLAGTRQICHWHLDEAALEAFLQAQQG